MEQLNINEIVDKLKKIPRKKLLEYKFLDYLDFCQRAFLKGKAQERLEEFKRSMPDAHDLHTALLLLAYIYRATSYIEEMVTPPLSPAKTVHNNIQCSEEKVNQPRSPAEPDGFDFPVDLKNTPTIRMTEYQALIEKADGYMLRIENAIQWESPPPKPKEDDSFFEILYRKFKTRKSRCNIRKEILFRVKEDCKAADAMRRKYYRWKKEKEALRTPSRSWPSREFLQFLTFCSFKFIEIGHNDFDLTNGNKKNVFWYAFGEGQDIQPLLLWKLMITKASAQTDNDKLVQKFKEACEKKHISIRDKEMKELAAKDLHDAVKFLCEANNKYRPRYSMQGALLGIEKYIKEHEWKAFGFDGLALTCTARELKIRQEILRIPLVTLPIGSIVHSISIEVDKAKTDFFQDLKKAVSGESDWLHCLTPQKKYEKIVFPATFNNFDLLMKNIDHISGSNVKFYFASGKNATARRLSGYFTIIPLKKK